jgi:hypothetical protein
MKNKLEKYHVVFAALFFVMLSIIATFPLITKIGTDIPVGGRDSFQVFATIESRSNIIENNGWIEGMKIILNQRLFNNYIFYIILNQFVNVYATNNILFLSSLAISGLGAYLLTFYFTKNKLGSLLAGIIFALNPFHIYQSTAIHVGTMHQEIVPFFILALFKFFENYRLKYYILAAFLLFLTALIEHQLLVFTLIFILFFLIYKVFKDKGFYKNKYFLIYSFTSLLALAFIALFFFGPLLKIVFSPDNYLAVEIKDAVGLSVRLTDPLVPATFNPILSGTNEWIQKFLLLRPRKGENYYIGLTVLAVVFYMFYQFIKRSPAIVNKERPNINFWLISTFTFFILSLGPAWDLGKHNLYLPYFLIYKFFPFFNNIRTVGRLYVFVMIGVAILFAYGFIILLKKYPSRKNILAVIIVILILFEYNLIPIKTRELSYSSFYKQIAKEQDNFKLLEIPGSTNSVFASYEMITTNIHGKQTINGIALVREIEGQYDLQQNTPILRELLYRLPQGKDPLKKITLEELAKGNKILASLNIKYITISKLYMEPQRIEETVKFIETYLKYEDKYEDDYLIAYRLPLDE